jgi:hypothetical protein
MKNVKSVIFLGCKCHDSGQWYYGYEVTFEDNSKLVTIEPSKYSQTLTIASD